MDILSQFHGPNVGYLLELYDRYQEDPASVDAATRALFERWSPYEDLSQPIPGDGTGLALAVKTPVAPGLSPHQVAAAVNLANAIRTYGHLSAYLDPLGSPPPGDPWLEPGYYDLSEDDLRRIPSEILGGPVSSAEKNALQAIKDLRSIYARGIGYEYGYIQDPEEREWLRYAAECGKYRPPDSPIDSRALLERLTEVEAFEHFLHRIFPGKTRFSIEGVDMLVPMLDELLRDAAREQVCTALIGMAHRGRLSVLAHVLGKPYEHLLAEFKDPVGRFPTRDELGWTGDVKYHKGAQRAIEGSEVIQLVLSMPPNPSHLEHIDPVLVGMARSAGSKVDEPGPPQFFSAASLPVLIHGDASFPGQGIVAETLNMSRLPGYSVGGAIHIIANNQLGYTTTPVEARSTLYASDLAKGFEIPIVHVNADDPIACIEATRTAFDYRQRFGKDFLIDLIGYRRYGHNEGDEPGFTQPVLYQAIEKHPTVREQWAQRLVKDGQIDAELPDTLYQRQMNLLQEIMSGLEPREEMLEEPLAPPPRGAARQVQTGVPIDRLRELNESLLTVPENFHVHRKMQRAMERRRKIFSNLDEPSIDWATAEELAFASILADGVAIRLTGEDVERGTFSQRHAVFHDTENSQTFTPLQSLPQASASFEVVNSPLSENAALGFEFGYNIQSPGRLVVWEAQYGDFINTAQAIIDEFIVSARAKWEQTPSLVLLLPHGNEGQGPDHSTGRPERFLQLAADTNMRVANCTTAAQYFHLLRRQAALLKTDPLPLIILTPKSLLRHPLVASPPSDFTQGRWQPVLDDPAASQHPEAVRRLIICSGKVYIDLVTSEMRQERPEIAIARLEQLYRFPSEPLQSVLDGYPNLQEVIWLQEEPQNMGAWTFLEPRLEALIQGRWPLRYIGRPRNASPAEGSAARHAANQKALISAAFNLETILVKEG